jgi:hypothetical protein
MLKFLYVIIYSFVNDNIATTNALNYHENICMIKFKC